MNIRRLRGMLALLVSVAAVFVFATPSSLAYVMAKSNTMHNTFTAVYMPPEDTSVKVCVHKTVYHLGKESISPEGFRFRLQNTDNSQAFTLTAGADGYASVALPFSEADLGKTHIYRLYEINDGRENVTYSDQVYTIEISLSVNEDNQIVAFASVDGRPVQHITAAYENIYNAGTQPPLTGDKASIEVYTLLLLISGAGMVLLSKRNGWVIK